MTPRRQYRFLPLLLLSAIAFPQPQRTTAELSRDIPRRLTIDQKRALLGSARNFAGQKLTISYARGDVEGETLAGDIAEVLRRAQWQSGGNFGVAATSFDDKPSGVVIGVKPGDARTLEAAQALLESLQSFGIVSSGGNDDRVPESTVSLVIGPKPRSTVSFTVPIMTPHTGVLEADPFVCPRPAPGGKVVPPADIRSSNGTLKLSLFLQGGIDIQGLKVLCYKSDSGVESPTLRVQPGDELIITFKNGLSPSYETAYANTKGTAEHAHISGGQPCSGGQMTPSSTNLHFHGWMIPPTCHQDDTLHTSIQPSDPPFEYRIRIPKDQPPGLYWYHPHPHGFTEGQVLGGASGALIVEGIERQRPEVAELPERVLVMRDQIVPGFEEIEGVGALASVAPAKNLSVNFVPVEYPLYHPADLAVEPSGHEFWRVLNASADTYFDLQLIFEGQRPPQRMKLIALDGVPVNATTSKTIRSHILLAPGGRVEFIVAMPPAGKTARLESLAYDTGPDGDLNPSRVLAVIRSVPNTPRLAKMPQARPQSATLMNLSRLDPAQNRKLYFSEDMTNPRNPKFFITLNGAEPKQFQMDFIKPDITVRQGTVEDWTIENRAKEAHAFHIHQLHFQVLERDGSNVSESTMRDTIDLPYWDGIGPYPSVKLRMDFRSPEIIGTFVFHCHILEHEDGGMMGSIEVVGPH